MALIWPDSFELTTVAAIVARYNSSDTSSMTVGTSSGRTNQYLQLGGGLLYKHFLATDGLIVGIARKRDTATEIDFLKLYDQDGTRQLTLREKTDGALALYRGDPTTTGTLLATSAAISFGFWIYIELKVIVHPTTGSYELRVNEATQFSASNVNTQETIRRNIERVEVNGRATNGGSPTNHYVDDYYIANLSNPMPVGLFFNNTKIEFVSPEGFGDVTGFTPVGNASNWQNVDERAHNSDTDYNYSATLNASDLFTMQNLSAGSGDIRGFHVTYVARKEDALTRWEAPLIKTGGVTYKGGNDSLTTSYVHYYEVWPFNPNTSTWFDVAGINSIQAGYTNASVA